MRKGHKGHKNSLVSKPSWLKIDQRNIDLPFMDKWEHAI